MIGPYMIMCGLPWMWACITVSCSILCVDDRNDLNTPLDQTRIDEGTTLRVLLEDNKVPIHHTVIASVKISHCTFIMTHPQCARFCWIPAFWHPESCSRNFSFDGG